MNTSEPETISEAIKLAPAYDSCLAGATVNLSEPDRFVYSLRKLIRFEMSRNQCSASEAREIITAELLTPLAQEHGTMSPVFLNDELVEGEIEDTEKPIIIVPKNVGGRRWK